MQNIEKKITKLIDDNMKQEKNENCIYKLIFPNSKIYVGGTKNYYDCIKEHKSNMINNPEKNAALYGDMLKYGWDKIKKRVLVKDVPDNYMAKIKRYFIDYYNSYNEERGYNQLPGLDFYTRFNEALGKYKNYKLNDTNELSSRENEITKLSIEYDLYIEIITIRFNRTDKDYKIRILGHNRYGGIAIFKSRNATTEEIGEYQKEIRERIQQEQEELKKEKVIAQQNRVERLKEQQEIRRKQYQERMNKNNS